MSFAHVSPIQLSAACADQTNFFSAASLLAAERLIPQSRPPCVFLHLLSFYHRIERVLLFKSNSDDYVVVLRLENSMSLQ